MKTTVLLPGTLCDERIFGALQQQLLHPLNLDHSRWSDAHAAAIAMLDEVPRGSIGISFSLGGWILLEMLRLDPSRFAGIVLVSGNAFPDATENARMRRDRVMMARDKGFDAMFAADWPLMLGPSHRADRAIQEAILSMAERAGHERHARQAEMNINRPDHRQLTKAPPIPIHVVAGTHDGLCPRQRYEEAASGPDSSLTLVEGVGHYVPLESPAVLPSLMKARFPEYCL